MAFLLLILLTVSQGCVLAANIKIEFLPPPMEGTISLGVYDSAGKLVRILNRESEVSEFGIALNGLITQWDGTDNKGTACPPGKYHARGFMVGDLEIEGVDFVGNDWVTEDESPRISKITQLATLPDGGLVLTAEAPGPQPAQPARFLVQTPDGEPKLAPVTDAKVQDQTVEIREGKVFQKTRTTDWQIRTLSGVTHPVDAAPGRNGTLWVIDGGEIKQFSGTGELQRKLPAVPTEPPPVKIAASPVADTLYVLDQNDALQQLRALDFSGAPATEPKLLFKQVIRFSDRVEQVAALLTFPDGKPFLLSPVLGLTLVPNPLMEDKPGAVNVRVAVDETGTILTTSDGLPLYRVSETTHLRWAVMGREPGTKIVTIYESDGAVVAEFKAARLADIMAFDAGELELAPPSASPAPAGKQDGEASPSPAATAPILPGTTGTSTTGTNGQ